MLGLGEPCRLHGISAVATSDPAPAVGKSGRCTGTQQQCMLPMFKLNKADSCVICPKLPASSLSIAGPQWTAPVPGTVTSQHSDITSRFSPEHRVMLQLYAPCPSKGSKGIGVQSQYRPTLQRKLARLGRSRGSHTPCSVAPGVCAPNSLPKLHFCLV